MAKRKQRAPKIHRVVLKPGRVVHVEVPPDHAPVAFHHPEERAMLIGAAPESKIKDRHWLIKFLLGER